MQNISYTEKTSVEKAQQYYNIMQNQITNNDNQQCKAWFLAATYSSVDTGRQDLF